MERRLSKGEVFPCLTSMLPLIDIDIFPGIHLLYVFLITIPSTSCTVERMFSTMNRIKTRSRKTMLTTRLSHLSLLSFESEVMESCSYDDVLSVFKEKPRRLML